MEHAVYPYAKAAAYLYGIYHIQDLINVLKYYEHKEYYRKELLEELSYKISKEDEIALVGSYVYATAMFSSFDHALDLYKKHKEKPFYYPELEEFSRYVDAGYVEVQPSHKRLAQFIKQHTGQSEKEITKLVRTAIRKIQSDVEMHDIMNDFLILGSLNKEQLSEFTAILMDVMNDTRRFSNHGFTPNELQVRMTQQSLGCVNK